MENIILVITPLSIICSPLIAHFRELNPLKLVFPLTMRLHVLISYVAYLA